MFSHAIVNWWQTGSRSPRVSSVEWSSLKMRGPRLFTVRTTELHYIQRRDCATLFSVVFLREFAEVFFHPALLPASVLFRIPYGSFLFKAFRLGAFSQISWVDPAIRLSGSAPPPPPPLHAHTGAHTGTHTHTHMHARTHTRTHRRTQGHKQARAHARARTRTHRGSKIFISLLQVPFMFALLIKLMFVTSFM